MSITITSKPSCLDNLITSGSGWRKIFTPVERQYKSSLRSLDLSKGVHINDEDFLLIFYALMSYLDTMFGVWPHANSPHTLAFGRDTRATGSSIIEAALHAVVTHTQASRVRIINMGVLSVPHIMSYARTHADGFVYITASHNPPEYNGIKFGSGDGGVLKRALAQSVIERFFSTYAEKLTIKEADERRYEISAITRFSTTAAEENKRAHSAYAQTALQAVFRGLGTSAHQSLEELEQAVKKKVCAYRSPLGIVWDTNGGARSTAFDEGFLSSLNLHLTRIHTDFGVFAHQIIPEGAALEDARRALIACNDAAKSESAWCAYPLALVSDCDGDRGNIIFYDDALPERTRVMKAQEVFVFVLSIELAWQRLVSPHAKLALVINGPSSMRCELIAARYNCEVFRIETGEANLVTKAEQLRSQGYVVPIVGEASNGGIIMYPSTVRDPLCTALSCIKLLLWQNELAHAELSNSEAHGAHAEVFAKQVQSLPTAATTEVEDALAKLEIPSRVSVQTALEHIAVHGARVIERFVSLFEDAGIAVARVTCCNFVGTTMREYSLEEVSAQGIEAGGLGFYFYRKEQGLPAPCGFVWVRPSGTEPLVRVVADAIGENAPMLERALIHAWRGVIDEAMP